MTNLIVLFLSLLLLPSPDVQGDGLPEVTHKFHVSYGQMGVEKNVAVCRIRFFKDDLTEALRQFHKDPALKMDVSPHVDSLFAAYFHERFRVKTDAGELTGRLAGSGEETMGQEAMWWYVMQFEASAPIRTFTVTNTLLFDLFDDQKNIFKVRYFPGENEKAYYFTEGSETYAVTF